MSHVRNSGEYSVTDELLSSNGEPHITAINKDGYGRKGMSAVTAKGAKLDPTTKKP